MIKDSFLSNVARDISEKFDNNFSNLNIIFTNKRAKTFFNEALYLHIQKPFFSPKYYTINDFVSKYSSLVLAEEIVLVYNLYEVYSEVYYKDKPSQEKESFESFYYWGLMLLRDFDDIDKHLANAKHIFKHIEDYKEIDNNFDFLTQEQKELLSNFFETNFNNHTNSEIQKRFISIWNCLFEIYTTYKEKLLQKGIGYSGMLYRNVVEKLSEFTKKENRAYCIIGFNVLNNVEKEIFKWLNQTYKTRFYWDYDNYYLDNHKQEAGLFMRENLKNFPMPKDIEADNPLYNTNLIENNQQYLEIISSPNENAQVGYISEWLNHLANTNPNLEQKDIAIILCNEDLLPSVLSALPERIGTEQTQVNITMGYKFKSSSMYSLINNYLNYQLSLIKKPTARLKDIIPFMSHSYFGEENTKIINQLIKNNSVYLSHNEIESFGELATFLNKKTTAKEILTDLQLLARLVAQKNIENQSKGHNSIEEVLSETLYRLLTALNNLQDLFENENITIKGSLLFQAIRSSLSSIMIPFEGDPVNGVQIMGLLESRSLDFKHILFLSANDDFLPNVSIESSFIPFSIRKAYNLTTIERKIAVFAYYFYRLLQHSKSIHFLYNSISNDVKPKEMSRFIQQLQVEANKEFHYSNFLSDINPPKEKVFNIIKHKSYIDEIIKKGTEAYFSPTYINDYFNCELRFFLKRVLKIENVEEFDDQLQDNVFGEIFHKAANKFYSKIIEDKKARANSEIEAKTITLQDIKSYEKEAKSFVKESFDEEYFKIKQRTHPKIEYNQFHKIKIEILTKYLKTLLAIDKKYAPFTILAMEYSVTAPVNIGGNNINIGGQIDRIDYKNVNGENILRVLDYKTNNSIKKEVSFDQLFFINPQDEPLKRNDYFLQIFLYSWLLVTENKLLKDLNIDKIYPNILYIKQANQQNYSSSVKLKSSLKESDVVENYLDYHNDFHNQLINSLELILTYDDNLECSKREVECLYCDYNSLCY